MILFFQALSSAPIWPRDQMRGLEARATHGTVAQQLKGDARPLTKHVGLTRPPNHIALPCGAPLLSQGAGGERGNGMSLRYSRLWHASVRPHGLGIVNASCSDGFSALRLVTSVWIIGWLLLPNVCEARPQVEVQLPRRDPIVGRPFPLKVVVEWEGDANEYLLLPLELPDNEGVVGKDYSMSSSKSGATNRVEYVVHLSFDKAGEAEFGSITVLYRVAGSEERQALQSDPLTINVRRNPLPMQLIMGAISAGSAAGLMLLGRGIVRSRREQHEEQRQIDRQERARELLERLGALTSLRIAGDLGGYLMGLVDIAAECPENVRESTSYKELSDIAERARFGTHYPSVEELDSSYRLVERWVKRDAEQPGAAMEQSMPRNG